MQKGNNPEQVTNIQNANTHTPTQPTTHINIKKIALGLVVGYTVCRGLRCAYRRFTSEKKPDDSDEDGGSESDSETADQASAD